MLTDSGSVKCADYSETQDHKIYQFPYARITASEVAVYSFKMGCFHQLISSKESDSVEFDSYFDILQANRSAFEKETGTFEDEDQKDEVKQIFSEKELVIVLLISSKLGKSQSFYPLVKERGDDKVITGMRLIKNSDNMKEVKFEDEVDETPHHAFFITSEEFGENYVDNFV